MAPPGLDQDHLAVEAGGLVHPVNEVLGEGPEEGPLAELEDPFRGVLQQKTVIAPAL